MGFVLRFKDKRCDDESIYYGFNESCRDVCASDDKCKYFSQWTYQRESDSRWCGTYKSCVTQSIDDNGPCLPDGAKVCPIKTFEKIGNFLNDLVNMGLLYISSI